jgi:hypothetical protein
MRKMFVAAMLIAAVPSPAAAQMQDGAPVEVPLRVEAGRLLVPVLTADGTELDFAISLGNVQTVLTESTAARLGDGAELTMGGLLVPTDDVATVPDASLTRDGTTFAGMISPNMLSQFDILVDVPGGRLVLKPFGRSVEWEGVALSDPVRLRIFHGIVLSLDIELNGMAYGAMLDLGTPELVVNEGVRTAAGIDAEDMLTLRVGSQTFADMNVSVLDLDVLRRFDPDGNGFAIVGAPLAYDCAISISWVHQELRTCVR